MPNQLIFDNWTLQDVKDIYLSGLSNDNASKIIIDKKKDSHSFQKIPKGFIQIEALFNLLQNIILRDTIIVDDRFTSTWDNNQRLRGLEQKGLIKSHNFKKNKIHDVRRLLVTQACVTTSISQVQKKNEEQFKEDGTPYDPLMSQIIWGGAGMLARSYVYETFYIPHPLRRYAFQQTPILSRDAATRTLNVIQSTRTQLFQFQNSLTTGVHANFSLPPFIVKVINESNDIDDLIKVSLQIRDEYKEFRDWINKFQRAIEKDDSKQILKYSKILKSVQQNIESKYNPNENGSLSLDFDLFTFKPSVSISISTEWFKNRFGIRSTLNDLILTESGFNSLKKLLSLLGEKNTTLSKKVLDEIVKNYSKK